MVLSLFKKKYRKEKEVASGGAKYYSVTVKNIIKETDDAISIIFHNPENEIKYKPGQFLTLILNIDGEESRRSYSLSSSPYDESDLIVTVKKVEGGHVSKYLVNQLKPGDQIRIMAPAGNFTTEFDPENKRSFVLFAGGSGITPLISIIKSALIKEPNSKIVLVYQNRNEDSIIFQKKLESLKQKYPDRLQVMYVLSQPSETWEGDSGRISPEYIKAVFGKSNIEAENTTVFVCGPNGMMETVESTLDDLKIDKKNRFKESFFGSDSRKDKTSTQKDQKDLVTESTVTILLDNEEHEITVKSNEFILETALDADLNMPFSCQGGICTSCRGKLISGQVKMEDPEGLSDEEIEAGYILTCVSHPASDALKIDME